MIGLMFAVFMLVFLRAWQQQNVIHRYYWWAAGTSYLMAACEVLVVLTVVDKGIDSIPFVGTGGALGVVSAMLLHGRLRSVK